MQFALAERMVQALTRMGTARAIRIHLPDRAGVLCAPPAAPEMAHMASVIRNTVNGPFLGNVQGQVGGGRRFTVQPVDNGDTGEVAQDRENHCLLQHDARDKAVFVAHGPQGSVFIEVLGYIGKQDLVNNDGAHHEAHDGAESEDITNRRGAAPVVLFPLDELLFGQHQHIVRQIFRQRVHEIRICVPAFVQHGSGQVEFRCAGRIWKQAQPVVVTGNDGAVDTERSPHGRTGRRLRFHGH